MELLSDILQWRHLADILLVAVLIYLIIFLLRGTIAASALRGLVILSIVVVAAHLFHLETLIWIIERLTPVILVGIVVLFQPEIRRGLARIGERSFGMFTAMEGERVVDEVARAASNLARRKHGAIIAFERETGLESFIETGILLNAEVTEELILTIFFPHTTLHDGAIIVRGNTLSAASCLLPLDHDDMSRVRYGTRHRAAVGLTRETDAVVVVVSEETGAISFAVGGQLSRGIDETTLKEMLVLYVGGTHGKRS